MGEHGKRVAPKAAAPAEKSRAAKVRDRSLRWGPLTAETAIVLGVAGAIFAGAFAVDAMRPTNERNNTTYGKDTVEVHQIGKGGIKPGVLTARVIEPPKATVAPTATGAPTPLPKPVKTATAVPTVAPTQPTSGGGGLPLPGGGTGGGSTKPCGLLGLGKCPEEKPDDVPAAEEGPEPGATATPGAGSVDPQPAVH